MVSSILVGVDDSAAAPVVLRWTSDLLDADPDGGDMPEVAALCAWTSPPYDLAGLTDGRLLEQAAIDALDRALLRVSRPERFERVIRSGPPAEVLIDEAERRDVDLIVVGRRGRTAVAELLLGSVGRTVAARSDRPVAIVPPSASGPVVGPSIVGYDGSPGADAALRWAATNGAEPIIAVSAWHLPTEAIFAPDTAQVDAVEARLEERLDAAVATLAAELPELGVASRVEAVIRQDDARLAILDEAKGAVRIVLGARAHRGVRGLLLGSTVDYIAAHANQAVVIVPPPHSNEADRRTSRAGGATGG